MAVTNRYISRLFRLGAHVLELHDENQFKVRAYENAASRIRSMTAPLVDMSEEELEQIEGIGKNLSKKILQIRDSGSYEELDRLMELTPPGLLELLQIKGLGAKKIRSLWKDLGITSPEELVEACEQDKVAALRRFGKKTQENVLELIHFYFESKGQYLYAEAEHDANEIIAYLEQDKRIERISMTGAMRRRMPVVSEIELLVVAKDNELREILDAATEVVMAYKEGYASAGMEIPLRFYTCSVQDWGPELWRTTGSEQHLALFTQSDFKGIKAEEEIYKKEGFPYIIPEMREGRDEIEIARLLHEEDIVKLEDIKGCLHNHSTYSDGSGSILDMANACMERGLEYFGISDHSKAAAYANGLQPKRVLAQMKEIDKLNKQLPPFRIFKGIESDILADGSLDYEDDVLKQFDFVVASVHAGLKMSEAEANKRLIAVIENPYTTILGHMTGRLLLQRKGFPVNYKKIIDACAANGVVIEINANPRRLDMDWQWLQYAVQKDVMLSINPDAHDMDEIDNMYFGVLMARKGGVSRDMVLNCKPLAEIEEFFMRKKQGRR